MIEKLTHFLGEHPDFGRQVFPLFGRQDHEFEKVASSGLLPEVQQYIDALKPRDDSQYVLVNALGAGEYYGSNSNGDFFSEESLIHAPSGWTGKPVEDRTLATGWPWGYPTFYGANGFIHHQNKDPSRAVGSVELAVWNPNMKRVELVVRLQRQLCERYGGMGVWEKIRQGGFPDVSMGARVPFDLCSITLDQDEYRKRVEQFKTERATGLNEGTFLAHWHKRQVKDGRAGIRGLQVTRDDYSVYCKTMMNKIFPDGRKVYVFNPHPKFFDISFVFIGADKTGKTMVHIRRADGSSVPAADMSSSSSKKDQGQEKTAAWVPKVAQVAKKAEIVKQVPAMLAGKAVPLLAGKERLFSNETMDELSGVPLGPLLSTLSIGGIVLNPREFQRMIVVRVGGRQMADDLDGRGTLFGPEPGERLGLAPEMFDSGVARLLDAILPGRSGFGPFIEKRTVIVITNNKPQQKSTSHKEELLRKIGSAYNGYREELLEIVPHIESFTEKAGHNMRLLGTFERDSLFTPLSVAYFNTAHR